MKPLLFIIGLLALLGLSTTIAQAHKLRVFAYGDGDNIVGETAFGDKRNPRDVSVHLQVHDTGKQLLTTQTDKEGRFSFAIPETARRDRLDLTVVVDAGEGHRGEWLVAAEEYLPVNADQHATTTVPKKEPARVETPTDCSDMDTEQMQMLVEEAVARQLAPVKHMLAKAQNNEPSLQDILGGLGYIIGLVGLAAYVKSKQ